MAAAMTIASMLPTEGARADVGYVPPPISIVQPQHELEDVNVEPEPVAVEPVSTVATEPPTATLEQIARYILRTAPAADLIRYYFGDAAPIMLRIARHESGLGRPGTTDAQACAADNPTSSAAGLFQTMGFHRALAEGIGLSWANVAGPDCLDDVLLALQLYDHGRGLRNWAGAY
jgi:hypothetical protein